MAVYRSKDSCLQLEIATVLTDIAGIRNIKMKLPSPEKMEIDDIKSDHVDLEVTGRTGGGTLSADSFWDPAHATWHAIHALMNTPAKADWSTTWGNSGTDIAFSGILESLELNAERTDPIMAPLEIAIAEKVVLPTS